MSNNEPASTSQNLSVPFYERRKVGRALGALLGLSAIAPLYWFASKGQPGLGYLFSRRFCSFPVSCVRM